MSVDCRFATYLTVIQFLSDSAFWLAFVIWLDSSIHRGQNVDKCV